MKSKIEGDWNMLAEKKKCTYEEFLKVSSEKRAEFIDGEVYYFWHLALLNTRW